MYFKIVYRNYPLETSLKHLIDALMGHDPELPPSYFDPFEWVPVERPPTHESSPYFPPTPIVETSAQALQQTLDPVPQSHRAPLLFNTRHARRQTINPMQITFSQQQPSTQEPLSPFELTETVEVGRATSAPPKKKEDSEVTVLKKKIKTAEQNKLNASSSKERNKYNSQIKRLKEKMKELEFQKNIHLFEQKQSYVKKHQGRIRPNQIIKRLCDEIAHLNDEIQDLNLASKFQTSRNEKNKISAAISRRRNQVKALNRELVEEQYLALMSIEKREHITSDKKLRNR